MTQADDWLAANATITCPYSARLSTGGCKAYQRYNPGLCMDCEHFEGRGERRRGRPQHNYHVFIEEKPMKGMDDLFREPEPSVTKEQTAFKLRTDLKVKAKKIAEETGYTFEAIVEVFFIEGIAKYEEMKASKK